MTGPRARGDAKEVPADGLAAVEQDPVVVETEVSDTRAELQVDGQLPVLGRRPEWQPLPRNLAEEVPLAQMRPLVGQNRLGADQRDVARKATVPQPGANRVAGRAGADDYRSCRS